MKFTDWNSNLYKEEEAFRLMKKNLNRRNRNPPNGLNSSISSNPIARTTEKKSLEEAQ